MSVETIESKTKQYQPSRIQIEVTESTVGSEVVKPTMDGCDGSSDDDCG